MLHGPCRCLEVIGRYVQYLGRIQRIHHPPPTADSRAPIIINQHLDKRGDPAEDESEHHSGRRSKAKGGKRGSLVLGKSWDAINKVIIRVEISAWNWTMSASARRNFTVQKTYILVD